MADLRENVKTAFAECNERRARISRLEGALERIDEIANNYIFDSQPDMAEISRLARTELGTAPEGDE